MPHFRVTKKLATALHVKLPTEPVRSLNPAHEWFADLFQVGREKCVIWVHRSTLFTFVVPGVRAYDLRAFPEMFRFVVPLNLQKLGLPESLADQLGVHLPDGYVPTDDRVVVGSMLDYRHLYAYAVADVGGFMRVDVFDLNAELNDAPMSALKGESAVRMLRRLAGSPETRH